MRCVIPSTGVEVLSARPSSPPDPDPSAVLAEVCATIVAAETTVRVEAGGSGFVAPQDRIVSAEWGGVWYWDADGVRGGARPLVVGHG